MPPVESPRCPICSSDATRTRRAHSHYTLAWCSRCRMVWDPQPATDQRLVYQESYFLSDVPNRGYRDYAGDSKIYRQDFRQRLMAAEKHLGRKGYLLDVGCALGDCLVEATELGWANPQGLDVSKYAVKVARDRGLNAFQGHLLRHPFPAESFDLILMQNLLEHTSDPLAQLKAAYVLLKPGGVLFLSTPNVHGLWRRLLGPLWIDYKPGEHLSYFSKNSLAWAFRESRFLPMAAGPSSRILSIGLACERLRIYAPRLFSALGRAARSLGIADMKVRLRTGELEAWATKSRRSATSQSAGARGR